MESTSISRFLCKRVIFNLVATILAAGLIYGFQLMPSGSCQMDGLALTWNHQSASFKACLPKNATHSHFHVR